MSTMLPQRKRVVRLAMLAAGALAFGSALADGTGWFTSSQTASGRFEYAQKCSVCRGAQLQGTGAPALKGTR